jgi:sarcosine oxidase subunit beta
MTVLCEADVAIIGGGIMGVSIAYQLAKVKKKVVVIEKSLVGSEASGRCGGGVRQQARHPYETPLAISSGEMWLGLNKELGVDTEYRKGGNIWLALTEEEHAAQKNLAPIQQRMGLPIEMVDRLEIRRLASFLRGEAILGGSYSPNCGHANPILTTRGFASAAVRLGVRIFEHTEVLDIKTSGDEVRSVCAVRGDVRAPVVVITAGAWTPHLGKKIGLNIPIRPSRDQLMVTEPIQPLCSQFILSSRVYFRQAVNGGVHIGTVNLPHTTFDQTTDPADLSDAAKAMTELVPSLRTLKVLRSWAGTSEKTPDDIPILGYVEKPAGVLIAAGFSGHGFALGPVIGRLMCELIVSGKTSLPISGFGLARFKDNPEGTPIPHWS